MPIPAAPRAEWQGSAVSGHDITWRTVAALVGRLGQALHDANDREIVGTTGDPRNIGVEVPLFSRKGEAQRDRGVQASVSLEKRSATLTRLGVHDDVGAGGQRAGLAAQGRAARPPLSRPRAGQHLKPSGANRRLGAPVPAWHLDEKAGAIVCPGPRWRAMIGANGYPDRGGLVVVVKDHEPTGTKQGQHPSVSDQDLGLQVPDTAGGRRLDECIEEIWPQPSPLIFSHGDAELPVAVRKEAIGRLAHDVLGPVSLLDRRNQAVPPVLFDRDHLLDELLGRGVSDEEAPVHVVLAEGGVQRDQAADIRTPQGADRQRPRSGKRNTAKWWGTGRIGWKCHDRIIDLAADRRKGQRSHKSGLSALFVCSIATDTGCMEATDNGYMGDANGPGALLSIELDGRFKHQVGAPNGPRLSS